MLCGTTHLKRRGCRHKVCSRLLALQEVSTTTRLKVSTDPVAVINIMGWFLLPGLDFVVLAGQLSSSAGFLVCLLALYAEHSRRPSREHFCIHTTIPVEGCGRSFTLSTWCVVVQTLRRRTCPPAISVRPLARLHTEAERCLNDSWYLFAGP